MLRRLLLPLPRVGSGCIRAPLTLAGSCPALLPLPAPSHPSAWALLPAKIRQVQAQPSSPHPKDEDEEKSSTGGTKIPACHPSPARGRDHVLARRCWGTVAKRLSSPPQAVPGSLGCPSLTGCPLPCPCLRQLCPPAAPRASQNGRGARHGGWRAGRAAPAAAPLPVGRPPGLAATELRGCSGNGHPAASRIPGSHKSHLPAGIGGKPGCVGHTGCMGCPGRTRKCAGFLGDAWGALGVGGA